MSDARKRILERIRANQRIESPTAQLQSADQWLAQRDSGPQPQWKEEKLDRFTAKLEQSGATCSRTDRKAVVSQILRFYEQHSLTNGVVSAATSLLEKCDWPDRVPVGFRAARPEDVLAVSEAYCAVAETGSLVLRSGTQTPTSLNFLPEYFVCLVAEHKIVDRIEDVWALLRGEGKLPRAVNFITGPSRTADVEQTIQMGAHGPRHVHVLLLGDNDSEV